MDDARTRFVENLQAGGTHGKGQIGIFVICRRIALIEAAKFAEQVARRNMIAAPEQ